MVLALLSLFYKGHLRPTKVAVAVLDILPCIYKSLCSRHCNGFSRLQCRVDLTASSVAAALVSNMLCICVCVLSAHSICPWLDTLRCICVHVRGATGSEILWENAWVQSGMRAEEEWGQKEHWWGMEKRTNGWDTAWQKGRQSWFSIYFMCLIALSRLVVNLLLDKQTVTSMPLLAIKETHKHKHVQNHLYTSSSRVHCGDWLKEGCHAGFSLCLVYGVEGQIMSTFCHLCMCVIDFNSNDAE